MIGAASSLIVSGALGMFPDMANTITSLIPTAEEKPVLRPSEAAQLLHWSKNTIYDLIKSGDLEVIKVKGRFWIPTSALRAYLRLPAA